MEGQQAANSAGSKEGLVTCSPGESKSTPFAADPQGTLCEDEMTKYPLIMTEAKERRGSVQQTDATSLQHQSQ